MSAWNDYSSSNEIAAWRVFIDYSLNRDGQANTPAQMSVFSSGVCARERVCVCVCLCEKGYAFTSSQPISCWIHSDIPVMKVAGIILLHCLIAINQTSTMASPPWLNDRH